MIPVTTISGVDSMGIYYYNNVKYFFFGDIHGHNKNNCDDKLNCDYFNYNFTKTKTFNTNCTTIGPLLVNWLAYNDLYDIKTDLYLEETYESNVDYNFNDLIKIRTINNYNTLSTIFPYKDISWLQLMKLILQHKQYNMVKIHHVDIRFYNHLRISPFSLEFIDTEIEHLINDKSFKNDVVNLVKILLLNYKFILQSLLSPNYQLDDLFKFILSKLSSFKTELLYTGCINE
jgi:hypothetical protein